MFIVNIDNIFNVLPKNALVSHADDTAVVCYGRNWNKVSQCLNNSLSKLDIWLKNNQPSLNIEKSTFVIFGNYGDSIQINLRLFIHNKKLKRVDNSKYLRVFFDSHTKWNERASKLMKKIKYFSFLFYKLSNWIQP